VELLIVVDQTGHLNHITLLHPPGKRIHWTTFGIAEDIWSIG
jgi:hypothetical protein